MKKINTIKNPLTIIAVFAGIAEVSGTTVLPFIDATNQLTFIYFLMGFPLLLILLFFGTLNFNNKVLYAPSDFDDENHFVKIMQYDKQRNQRIEVQLDKNAIELKLKNSQIFQNKLTEDVKLLEKRLHTIEVQPNAIEKPDSDSKNLNNMLYSVSIPEIPNAKSLISNLRARGVKADLYDDINDSNHNSPSESKSIWMGINVPLDIAQTTIKESIKVFPFLSYIDLSEDSDGPAEIHDNIFIGGATNTALEDGLKPFKSEDFEKLFNATTQIEFQEIIKAHNNKYRSFGR